MKTMTLDDLCQTMGFPLERRIVLNHGIAALSDEFRGTFGPEAIERYFVDSLAELDGSRVTLFLPLFAERFARDRLWSLAKVEGRITVTRPTVLFLCVQNAGRSQMAAGWLHHLAGERVKIMTGGSDPANTINPGVTAVMAEVGIDISQQFPKPWTDEVVRAADVVVTMGCGDACPIFPGKRYEDWAVADPAGEDLDGVRAIRDAIRGRVQVLMGLLNLAPGPRFN